MKRQKPAIRKAWTIFFHNDKDGEFQSRTYLTKRNADIFYVKTMLLNKLTHMTSLYVHDERRRKDGNTRREGKGTSKKASKKARGVLALSGAERDGVP